MPRISLRSSRLRLFRIYPTLRIGRDRKRTSSITVIAAHNSITVSLDRCRQPRCFCNRSFGTDPHQHNARDRPFPAKNKIAKILVFGKQKPVLTQREHDYVHVA